MTEAQWLSERDPEEMIGFLTARASDRKLRLFACSCARLVWNHLEDGRSREAVEGAERFADGGDQPRSFAFPRRSTSHPGTRKARGPVARTGGE